MKITKSDNRPENRTHHTHTFTYEIEIENIGDTKFENGHNLEVSDTVPAHFTVLRITESGHTDPNNKQRVIWGGIELEPGQKKTFKIEVGVEPTAPTNTPICNVAIVSFEEGERDRDDECITVEREPQIAATVAPKPVPVTPLSVPITAPTGAAPAAAAAATLLGTGSLAFFLRKFW